MEKGEVRFDGPTAELLDRARHPARRCSSRAPAAGRRARASSADAGADAGASPSRRAAIVLEVDGAARSRFGGIRAVDDVDFDARTRARSSAHRAERRRQDDAVRPHLRLRHARRRRRSCCCGERRHRRSAPDARGRARPRPLVPGRPAVPVAHRRRDIAVALERHVEVRDPIAAALRPARRCGDVGGAGRRRASTSSIELIGLGAFRDKFVRELSTGTPAHRRPRLRARPRARRCCCSTSRRRASPSARPRRSARCCSRIRDETGCALLVIEHDMPLITSISDEIARPRPRRGRRPRRRAEVLEHPRVVASYLGTAAVGIEALAAGGAGTVRPMKFGLFYEISVPRPWTDGAEKKVYNNASSRCGWPTSWASTRSGRSSTTSSRSTRTARRPSCSSPPARC